MYILPHFSWTAFFIECFFVGGILIESSICVLHILDVKTFLVILDYLLLSFSCFQDQDNLFAELRSFRFFDVFEYNGISHHWGCFLCNHPDRAANFLLQKDSPVIERDLKEKKSKWLLFRRWRTKHFSLNGSNLSCRERVSGLN